MLSDQPPQGPAAFVPMHFTKSSVMHRRRIDWGRESGSRNHEERRDEMTLSQGVKTQSLPHPHTPFPPDPNGSEISLNVPALHHTDSAKKTLNSHSLNTGTYIISFNPRNCSVK